MPDILDALEAAHREATPGEWAWNSYSRVCSVPMLHAEAELENEHEAAGAPWDSEGNYPEPWKSRAEAVESTVCTVPAHHGDTATGRHAADAVFILTAHNKWPALLDVARKARALDLTARQWQALEVSDRPLEAAIEELRAALAALESPEGGRDGE